MSGWLRRNWIALATLVVLIPATIGLTFSAQWLGYFATWPSQPTVVAVSQTESYGGADWTVIGSDRVSADSDAGRDAGLPKGTDLVRVQVRVDPNGVANYCTLALDELRDDSILRSWNANLYYSTAEKSGCDSEYTVTYSFEAAFLVPSDAGTDDMQLAVNLSVVDELPHYLRLYF
jgi:hypothetical protein